MSYAALYGAKKGGKMVQLPHEYHNAYGFSGLIWESVRNALGMNSKVYLYDSEVLQEVIERAPSLGRVEEAVTLMTCDRYMVKRANFQKAANCLRLFHSRYPPEPGVADHLLAMAADIERLPGKIQTLGFWVHSGGECLWDVRVECKACGCTCSGETRPYNVKKDTEHTEVFEGWSSAGA